MYSFLIAPFLIRIKRNFIGNSIEIVYKRWLLTMQKVKPKGLQICEKCGNVMVMRVLKRESNPKSDNLDRILQCIVCRHWIKFS